MAQRLAVAEGAEGGRCSPSGCPPSLAVTGPVSQSLSLGFPHGPLGVQEAHTTSGGMGRGVHGDMETAPASLR